MLNNILPNFQFAVIINSSFPVNQRSPISALYWISGFRYFVPLHYNPHKTKEMKQPSIAVTSCEGSSGHTKPLYFIYSTASKLRRASAMANSRSQPVLVARKSSSSIALSPRESAPEDGSWEPASENGVLRGIVVGGVAFSDLRCSFPSSVLIHSFHHCCRSSETAFWSVSHLSFSAARSSSEGLGRRLLESLKDWKPFVYIEHVWVDHGTWWRRALKGNRIHTNSTHIGPRFLSFFRLLVLSSSSAWGYGPPHRCPRAYR